MNRSSQSDSSDAGSVDLSDLDLGDLPDFYDFNGDTTQSPHSFSWSFNSDDCDESNRDMSTSHTVAAAAADAATETAMTPRPYHFDARQVALPPPGLPHVTAAQRSSKRSRSTRLVAGSPFLYLR